MKLRMTVVTTVLVLCALVATALPAGAKPAPKPPRPGAGAGLDFTPTGIASFALEKALGAGASQAGLMVLKSLGLNKLFPDPTEEALKRIEGQLDGIKTQLTDVQNNLNQVKAYIVEQGINDALRTIQDRWTEVLDLYNRFFVKVLDQAQHLRDVKDDPKSTPADIEKARLAAINARDDFYRQFDALGYGGMVGQFHNRIVPSQGTTLMKLQGRELLITKRFLTSADSRILRNTFDVIAEQEALLSWMKMERTAPSDRSAYDGAPAPGAQRDFDNAREELIRNTVEEAQYLPPAIPTGVVLDVGGLDKANTDNATMWMPATDAANLASSDLVPGPDRVSDALASANTNHLGEFDDWRVPSRAQIDTLVTDFRASSQPTFTNYLSDLNPNEARWQAIRQRSWPSIWAGDAVSRTVRCGLLPPIVVRTVDARPSVTTATRNPAWSTRPDITSLVPVPLGSSPATVCDNYVVTQFNGARGGLLVARSTGTMPMDYMAQKSGANLRPGVNLRGADLSDLNLTDTDLRGADLTGARLARVSLSVNEVNTLHRSTVLTDAKLGGVSSGGIVGTPAGLPAPWRLMNGYLVGPTANLQQADLTGLDLSSTTLTGVRSGNTACAGCTLPADWRSIAGYLVGPTANLQSAELSGVNLAGMNLAGANLAGANMTQGTILTGANLTGASLVRAQLPVAKLANANFTNANLTQANLTGANAAPANFTNANLTQADLDGVNAAGATFTNANLTNTTVNALFVAPGADFTRANLTGASWQLGDLSTARLTGTTVTGARLQMTLTGVVSGGIVGTFASNGLPAGWRLVAGYLVGPGANLLGADFASQNITGVDFSGLNLTGTNLQRANLTNAVMRDTNLRGVVLTGATITGATFTTVNDHLFGGLVSGGLVGTPRALPNERFRIVQGFLVGPTVSLAGTTFPANAQLGTALTGTDFTGARLTGINFTGAQMTQATLVGATLTNSNLTRVNFARANLARVISGGIVGSPTLPSGWRVIGGYLIGPEADLRGANLANADLTGVNLAGALLTGATLTGVTWSDTICPNGLTQSSPCSPLIGGTPTTVNAAASKTGGALVGDIEPDLGRGAFTFRVEGVSEGGGWLAVDTYASSGPDETWNINLPAGTYRVVVLPQLGYAGATSAPVVLTK